jgi:DNA-binding response OmpR family regulator
MSIRIAVFNDYPQNLKLIHAILSKKGFEVYTFEQNFVEIEEVEKLKPHLMILAYVLGYDGDQLRIVRRLKENLGTSGIPIIICTTGMISADGDPSLDNVPIIPKPFDISDLLREVNQILYSPNNPEKQHQ